MTDDTPPVYPDEEVPADLGLVQPAQTPEPDYDEEALK